MVWSTVVLIPKGGGGFRGIGLLELLWKVIESIMNRRIMASVSFHDCLHGFVPRRGTGTGCIEAKLAQQLNRKVHQTLFTVFVDLKKAFDTVHRGRLLDILAGYGVGPRLRGLLRCYWDNQQCVARQADYHGTAFQPSRGVTQGGIISPTLFNILVDAVVRKWLADTLDDPEVAISGLQGASGGKVAVFYADDGMVGSTDPDWLRSAIQHLCDLFRAIGLKPNTSKTQVMTCHPGDFRSVRSVDGYKRQLTGTGASYRDRKRRRTVCPVCDKDVSAASLASHLASQHGILSSCSIVPDGPLPAPARYALSFPPKTCQDCPVNGCPYRATSSSLLQRHFFYQHPTFSLFIKEDGHPRFCDRCGMSVSLHSLRRGHQTSKLCDANVLLNLKRERMKAAREARAQTFTIDGDELEKVRTFKYLGRIVSDTDTDWPALQRNLQKARGRLARISPVLAWEGASPSVAGMFYRAAVLSIALYGSETWVWTDRMVVAIRGFHHRAARLLSGKLPRRRPDGSFEYCPADDALKMCSLQPVQVYIARRRDHLLTYVRGRPIYAQCRTAPRAPGTPSRTRFWWEQDLSQWADIQKDEDAEGIVLLQDDSV